MVKKVISGSHSGAGRAALDFALEIGIPSIPGDPLRMDQNVINSHGTLIISHGGLSEGALRTKELADQLKRPCLQIDLTRTNGFTAARKIIHWIVGSGIEILNVVGRGADKDPQIYQETIKLLRTSYYMAALNEEMQGPRTCPHLPGTIEEALESLTSSMSLKEKTRLARMEEGELTFFHPALAAYVSKKFGLSAGNWTLMAACRTASDSRDLDEDGASFLITRKLCDKLKSTHSLRLVVKGKACSTF